MAPRPAAEREPIAIVGISCAFPAAPDPDAFWSLLLSQQSASAEVAAGRWDNGDRSRPGADIPRYGALLREIDRFDAAAFNIAPIDAELMDPQQRLMLEHATRAIEDAGYRPTALAGRNIGVFAGVQHTDYWWILNHRGTHQPQVTTGNAHALIANRVSYTFDLHGPSEVFNSGETASLHALHRAVSMIRSGGCEAALCGGVNVILRADTASLALGRSGESRAGRLSLFGEADGTVIGEGVGVVFLKSLSRALADRDSIYATVRNTALAHRGNADALDPADSARRADLVVDCLQGAGIGLRQVDYIEIDAGGSSASDAIEFAALRDASSRTADASRAGASPRRCGLGSVKANIGDLGPASGVASVIKLALAMRHGVLPGTPGSGSGRGEVPTGDDAFYVVSENRPWTRSQRGQAGRAPCRAGVSGLAAGGACAHVLLEEFIGPSDDAAGPARPRLLVLSGETAQQLDAMAVRLLRWLERNAAGADANRLRDLAFTLHAGREEREFRLAIVASSWKEFRDLLTSALGGDREAGILRGRATRSDRAALPPASAGTADDVTALLALAQQWIAGARVDWSHLHPEERPRRLWVPTRPPAHERYWYEASAGASAPAPERGHDEPPGGQHMDDCSAVRMERLGDGIASITLQDEANHNMFTRELVEGLVRAMARVAGDDAIKVVLLAGQGPSFCMGGSRQALDDIVAERTSYRELAPLYEGLLRCPVPVVCAMQGHAAGAGFVFGLYADIVVLAEEARYSANFMNFGLTPGLGATLVLRNKLGNALGSELMLTGASYTGAELRQRGVPFTVAPQSSVVAQARSIARSLAEKPRLSLQLLKRELAKGLLDRIPQVIATETELQRQTYPLPEVATRIREHFRRPVMSTAANPATSEQPRREGNGTDAAGPSRPAGKVALAPTRRTNGQAVHHDAPGGQGDTVERPAVAALAPRQPSGGEAPVAMSPDDIRSAIVEILRSVLHLERGKIGYEVPFSELGIDSIHGVEIVRDLNRAFAIDLSAITLYDHPTLTSLVRLIESRLRSRGD